MRFYFRLSFFVACFALWLFACENEPADHVKITLLTEEQVQEQLSQIEQVEAFAGLYNVNLAMGYYIRDTGLSFEELKDFCSNPEKYDQYHNKITEAGINSGMVAYYMQQLGAVSRMLMEQYPDLRNSTRLREALQESVNRHSMELLEYFTKERTGSQALGAKPNPRGTPCLLDADCVLPLFCIQVNSAGYKICADGYVSGYELEEVLIVAPLNINQPDVIFYNPFDNGGYNSGHVILPYQGGGGGRANYTHYPVEPAVSHFSSISPYNLSLMNYEQIISLITASLAGQLNIPSQYAETVLHGVSDENRVQLFLFLEDNPSPQAQSFAFEAIGVLKVNVNLNFKDLERLVNGMDKDCQALVLFKSILKVNSTFTNLIKDSYLDLDNPHIAFADIGVGEGNPPLLSSMGARTQPYFYEVNSEDEAILIEFNNDYLDTATDLGIVSTLYHELLHAHVLHLYHGGKLLTTYPDYTSLNTAFNNYFSDDDNLVYSEVMQQEMHNIYIDFIDVLAESLVKYSEIYNIEGVDLEFARKLVWGGLNGNKIFTDNLTLSQRNEAQTLLAREHFNLTDAKSDKTCN